MLSKNRIYSRFNSRKNKVKQTPTRKLITFQLGSEKYAIPIEKVLRILDKFTPRAALKSGKSLLKEQEQIITLLDPSILLLSSQEPIARSYLIVCTLKSPNLSSKARDDEEKNKPENAVEYIGIPIPEVPKVLEIAEDKFGEVPEFYRQGNLSDAVEKIINLSEDEIVFYLNLESLYASA